MKVVTFTALSRLLAIGAIAGLLMPGCKSGSPTSPQPFTHGNYAGSLLLTEFTGTDSAKTTKYPIAFTFADTGWYSYAEYFPTGAGTFAIQGDSLILTDKVAHLAIFDWTLILGGSFYRPIRADSLVLIQDDSAHRRRRYISLFHIAI